MTLYTKTVTRQGPERLTLNLIQYGAATKPYYLAQLRHVGTSPMDLSEPITFFLEQWPEPTRAIDLTTRLFERLTEDPRAGLEAILDRASSIAKQMHQIADLTREPGTIPHHSTEHGAREGG